MPTFYKGIIRMPKMYQWYTQKNPKDPVDRATYRLICETWGLEAQEYLLLGKDIPLYVGFKAFGIRKGYRPTFIDRNQSRIQGKTVYGSNAHSDNWVSNVYWKRIGTRIPIRGWKFRPSRTLSRALAVVMKIPGGHRRFVEQLILGGTSRNKIYKKLKL